MATLDSIREPVIAELAAYEEYLRDALRSPNTYVSSILNYIFSTRGKGIRPLLVMLVGLLHRDRGEIGERSFLAAMLIEMLHTASLVHDDVVDEAYVRRSKPAINALWRSRTSVLIGDYIFARSFAVGLDRGAIDIVTFITKSIGEVCEGELEQSQQSDRLEMTREIYLDIIYKKTATLIGASSGVGALAVGASTEEVDRMKRFGDWLGIAFQIKDDILDYSLASQTGKPACGDLRERKITLPLLTVLESVSERERKHLIARLSDIRKHPEYVDYLRDAVIAGGGLERSAEVMNDYLHQAKMLLDDYPDSPCRRSLLSLCDYIAERNK